MKHYRIEVGTKMIGGQLVSSVLTTEDPNGLWVMRADHEAALERAADPTPVNPAQQSLFPAGAEFIAGSVAEQELAQLRENAAKIQADLESLK
jgi:hypothetical protein